MVHILLFLTRTGSQVLFSYFTRFRAVLQSPSGESPVTIRDETIPLSGAETHSVSLPGGHSEPVTDVTGVRIPQGFKAPINRFSIPHAPSQKRKTEILTVGSNRAYYLKGSQDPSFLINN